MCRLVCSRGLWSLLALLFAAAPASAQPGPARHDLHLRLRLGVVAAEGENRQAQPLDAHGVRARVQAGGTLALSERVRVRAGWAVPLGPDETALRLRGPAYRPGPGGARAGDVVLDRLAVEWEDRGIVLRVGRLQTAFALPGLAAKSLLRYDSPSFDVHWTDGVHATLPAPGGGRVHLLALHTPDAGVATALRAPLRFEDDPVGFFVAWEGAGPQHRAVHLLVHPEALPRGEGYGAFVAVTGQLAHRQVLSGAEVVLAAEGGVTLTPPERALVGAPGEGHAGPLAGQLALTVRAPEGGRHAASLLVAAAGSGWLASADFPPNAAEVEARYAWQLDPRVRLTARLRARQDLLVPLGARQRQAGIDAFLRLDVRL